MAVSNPLGEKYARYRALNPTSRRSRSRSPIKASKPSRPALRSLSKKYDDLLKTAPTTTRRTGLDSMDLRGSIRDSPIKILRGSSVSQKVPDLYRRASPERSWEKQETHGVTKTRRWLEKKESAARESSLQKESVFSKLRSYLSKLTPSDDAEYKQLSESAGLTKPESLEKKEKMQQTSNRVSFEPDLFQRRYASWDKVNERDEVDEEVQKAKTREEMKRLNERVSELEQLLALERKSSEETKEGLERELYLARQDHQAVVSALREEVKELEMRASRRYKELEREKIAQLRSEVLQENEFFLKQQNAREENLRRREAEIEERALELDKTRIDLEKREIDVKVKEDYIKKAEARFRDRQIEDKEGTLREKLGEIEAKIRQNEDDRKKFQEIVRDVSDDTRNMRDHNLRHRLNNLNLPVRKSPETGIEKWEALFKDYDEYFRGFEVLGSDSGNYDAVALDRIERNFKQLQTELREKIQRRDFRISQLDNLISKSWVKRHDFDIVKAERIAQYLKNRDALCEKQRTNYTVLRRLSELRLKLSSIQAATN